MISGKFNKILIFCYVPLLTSLITTGCNKEVKTYSVDLINNYDGALSLSNNKVKEGEEYQTDITLNKAILKDKSLPNALEEKDVLCGDSPIKFTYTLTGDSNVAKLNISKENIKGDIKINVKLIDIAKTFSVTLDANEGEFPNGEKEIVLLVKEGQSLNDIKEYNRPINFPVGYHFSHWIDNEDPSVILNEDDVIPYKEQGARYKAIKDINIINITIDPNKGTFPGKEPEEIIELITPYGTKIDEIEDYPGEPTLTDDEFLYYIDQDGNHYSPDDYVIIEGFDLSLLAIYKNNLSLTLDPDGGIFPIGAETQFRTFSGITLNQLDNYKEPSKVGYVFKYWTYNSNIYYENTPIELEGKITLKAYYEKCEHTTFVDFTIIDNRLYGICPICKDTVLIKDDELTSYNNKYLLKKEGSNESKIYSLYEMETMSTLVTNLEAHSTIDMYLISGINTLYGYRYGIDNEININIHGLFKNDGATLSAGVNCTKSSEYPFPREYGNINFVFNNLIMQGENTYEVGFYFGIYALSNTYNNCLFIGKQSFYSYKVTCNNCVFDCRNMLDKPDYAIYTYTCFDGTFNDCEFKSDQKGLKIYADGCLSNNPTYNLTNCVFNNIGKVKQDKAAIEIDSTNQSDESKFIINLKNCSQDGFAELYSDKANPQHSEINIIE